MAEEPFLLSPTGYEVLKRELAALESDYKSQFAQFTDTNDDTDSSMEEAAEFDAQVRKEFLEERIGHLKLVLSRAEIIVSDANPHLVDPGEQVTVWDFNEKCERTFNLVSSTETIYASEGIKGYEISTDSPVGMALLGKKVGDVVEVHVPDGISKFAIRRIEPIK